MENELIWFICSNCRLECPGYPEEDEDGHFWCITCMIERPEPTYDTVGKQYLMCPYCGKNQLIDDTELKTCGYDQECIWCNKYFDYEREIVAFYTSTKKKVLK